MTENPFKPTKETETPKPKSNLPKAERQPLRVVPYRWPGETKEGFGDFNQVRPGKRRSRRGRFMEA